MNKVNVENLLKFIKDNVALIALKSRAPVDTAALPTLGNAELDNIYNFVNSISGKKAKGKALNGALYVSLACTAVSFILIFAGSKSASASMAPSTTMLIAGVLCLVVSLIALIAILCVRKKNLTKDRDLIINNLEKFILNEIKDIINKNPGVCFNSINDDSKTRLIQLSFLYGVVYELCRETNVYGSDDINGPYTRPKGFEVQYEVLERRVQYLVSMIDTVRNKLREDTSFIINDNNQKFFNCKMQDISINYGPQFTSSTFDFSSIKGETTGIKFKKDGQPDIELTPGRFLDIAASICKKVPVFKLCI